MKQYHMDNRELSWLCRELAILLHAGVILGDGLSLLAEEESGTFSALLTDMSRAVDGGLSLSRAMSESGCFPAYACGMVEVGERTGRTEQSLAALAAYYERREDTQRQLKATLTYPAILLLLMLIVIAVLLVKVLPVFNEVYTALGSGLTGFAGGLLLLGQWLDTAMPVLCFLLAAAVSFLLAFTLSGGFRDRVTARWQSRFGERGIARKLGDAQFAQALALSMQSGLSPAEALELCATLFADRPHAAARCHSCAQAMNEGGEGFAEALSKSELLPPTACRLLSFGLRSGAGDEVMETIAARLADDAEQSLTQRIAQIEPTLVLVTSLLVGAILLSVMLPLMNIMSTIG